MKEQTVRYEVPGMNGVRIERDEARRIDIYYPPAGGDAFAAVILVAGYPDEGFARIVGCSFTEMGSTTSWARLIAASGVAAIAYANREPAGDLRALLAYLRQNAAALRIDPNRLALWASSGNAALATSALIESSSESLRGAALLYPYTLDCEEAAKAFRFANPAAGRTVADLPDDMPLLLVRAGRDEMPNLNASLDRLVADALARNLPLTLVNHATGPHAFDLTHDSEETRRVVAQVLAFLGGVTSART